MPGAAISKDGCEQGAGGGGSARGLALGWHLCEATNAGGGTCGECMGRGLERALSRDHESITPRSDCFLQYWGFCSTRTLDAGGGG